MRSQRCHKVALFDGVFKGPLELRAHLEADHVFGFVRGLLGGDPLEGKILCAPSWSLSSTA